MDASQPDTERPVPFEPWHQAVRLLVLHGRMLDQRSRDTERARHVAQALAALRTRDRHVALTHLRNLAARDGGLAESALVIVEDAVA